MARNMGERTTLESGPQLTAHRRSLNALTGIRFFAAYFVVIFHSRLSQVFLDHHLYAAGNFVANGFLAVPLFFALSGFILAYTYEGQMERSGAARRFWEARFSRIWPVYAVSLLFASLHGLQVPRVGAALATLGMVQAWNPFEPSLAGSWNFVCWTLSVEAFFYLIFPWVQLWLERRGTRQQLLWIGGMLALCVATNSGSRTLGYTATGFYRFIPLPILHLPEFLTGVGMGNYFLRASATRKAGRSNDLLRGRGVWTYGSALLSIALLTRPVGAWTSLVVVGFALLIYGLAAESTMLSRFLSTPAMVLGGGISFSVYLMQLEVKDWVNLLMSHFHQSSTSARLLLNVVVLTLLSLLLFKAVENPARKVLRSFFARLEERRAETEPEGDFGTKKKAA